MCDSLKSLSKNTSLFERTTNRTSSQGQIACTSLLVKEISFPFQVEFLVDGIRRTEVALAASVSPFPDWLPLRQLSSVLSSGLCGPYS